MGGCLSSEAAGAPVEAGATHSERVEAPVASAEALGHSAEDASVNSMKVGFGPTAHPGRQCGWTVCQSERRGPKSHHRSK